MEKDQGQYQSYSAAEEAADHWKLLRWNELPDFDLYSDQLLSIVAKQLDPFLSEKDISSSMVNNYVKQGLMPKPKKKKYTKEHIALLTAISVVKQVFTMDEVAKGIRAFLETRDISEGYDIFCNGMERQIRRVFLNETVEAVEDRYLNEALGAVAGSLYVKAYLRRAYEEE